MRFNLASMSPFVSTLLVLSIPVKAFSTNFEDAVTNAYKSYPTFEREEINKLAAVVTDWVLHYEKAVTSGTGYEYTDNAKTNVFNRVLANSGQCSKDINLSACAQELICEDKIFANFWPYWKTHNCQ